MSVRIVTDSACDLPQTVADELGIEIVPLTIRFGDEEFVDRRDLTPTEFWARSAASPMLPETAAPSPGQFEAAYRSADRRRARPASSSISLSGALSATMQSAELAARDVADEIPVTVVDSHSVHARARHHRHRLRPRRAGRRVASTRSPRSPPTSPPAPRCGVRSTRWRT